MRWNSGGCTGCDVSLHEVWDKEKKPQLNVGMEGEPREYDFADPKVEGRLAYGFFRNLQVIEQVGAGAIETMGGF